MAIDYADLLKKENNFTSKENNGNIKAKALLKLDNLNETQKRNIESAKRARAG